MPSGLTRQVEQRAAAENAVIDRRIGLDVVVERTSMMSRLTALVGCHAVIEAERASAITVSPTRIRSLSPNWTDGRGLPASIFNKAVSI